VATTTVRILNWKHREPDESVLVYRVRPDGSLWETFRFIGPNGVASLDGLQLACSYSIFIGPVDGAFASKSGIAAGTVVDVSLEKGSRITGSVVGPTELSPEAVEVRIYFVPGFAQHIAVDEALHFTVPCPASGSWQITATASVNENVSKASIWAQAGQQVQLSLAIRAPPR
jgi:hypothetical protein